MSSPGPEEVLISALRDITRQRYGMQSIIEEHEHDVNAFNYHAMEYYRRQVQSYQSTAFKALKAFEEAKAAQDLTDKDLFDRLAYESWDLRSINVPTGGDDYLVHWIVIEHDGEEGREIGRAYDDDPREALRDAIRRKSKASVENQANAREGA